MVVDNNEQRHPSVSLTVPENQRGESNGNNENVSLPRMTGGRLAAEVLEIRPSMPLIICTGYSERMSAKKAEALGVRKYIEKPIDLRNLASALREVLEGKYSRGCHAD